MHLSQGDKIIALKKGAKFRTKAASCVSSEVSDDLVNSG